MGKPLSEVNIVYIRKNEAIRNLKNVYWFDAKRNRRQLGGGPEKEMKLEEIREKLWVS